MNTFVIFDRKTGEILQTHVQLEKLHCSPEELLRTARPEAKVDTLEVLEVADLAPGASYRVDVKAKKLIKVEAGTVPGAAGAYLQPLEGEFQTAGTTIMYAADATRGLPTGDPELREESGRQLPESSDQRNSS